MNTKQHEQEEFERAVRQDLTLALLNRADYAGEILRALLFAGAGAALGFVLEGQRQGPGQTPSSAWHIASALLFLVTIAATLYSWDLQKRKAVERFNAAFDYGVMKYRRLLAKWRGDWRYSNRLYDGIAACALGAGVLVEIVLWASGK